MEAPVTMRKCFGPKLTFLFLAVAFCLIPEVLLAFCHKNEFVQNRSLFRLASTASSLGNGSVRIEWLGHATFQITSSKGTRTLMDPSTRDYIIWPTAPHHIVTTSHNHEPHSNYDLAIGNPIYLDGLTEDEDWNRVHTTVRDVSVYNVPAYHDKSQGLQRGKNSIFVVRADNICIAHLGDLGHKLTEQQLKQLGRIDVLLVPIGGGRFTIPADEGLEVIKQIRPRIAIPMHYWWETATNPLVKGHKNVKFLPRRWLQLRREELPSATQIVILDFTKP
jgi:L-ascorbate metabolism protein UlaG (beta-lactamase superfamily)